MEEENVKQRDWAVAMWHTTSSDRHPCQLSNDTENKLSCIL